MSKKYLGPGGLLAGVALGGVALWLARRHHDATEATEPTRGSADSWLPDDILDSPPDPKLGTDAALAEIFDRQSDKL